MTPNQLKEKFSLAWGEFAIRLKQTSIIANDILEDVFELWADNFITYLDSIGMIVNPDPILYPEYKNIHWYITVNSLYREFGEYNSHVEDRFYPTRPEATAAGIEKAFEIREKQLEDTK